MEEALDSLLRLVAKSYYIDELDQSSIAELVGVSRSQVSRLLTRARKEGIVQISVAPYQPRNAQLEARLAERFGLRHTVVIRTLGNSDPIQVRRMVGHLAAPVVAPLIRPGMVVGVAGGRTLYELTRWLPAAGEPRNITAVQLMGNVGHNVAPTDAIEISRVLAQRLGGTQCMLHAPAYAPDAHTRDAFLSHEQIRSIWQLYGVMQIALVGIGTLEDSVFSERGVLGAEEIRRLRGLGVVGEICGRYYDVCGQECRADSCERVISIELDELRRRPEVVGVTHGAGRAQAIRAALQGRLLKSLVIDEAGAAALLALP